MTVVRRYFDTIRRNHFVVLNNYTHNQETTQMYHHTRTCIIGGYEIYELENRLDIQTDVSQNLQKREKIKIRQPNLKQM